MKKIISFALAAIMTAAMSATAFAAEIDQDDTLPAQQDTSITYTVAPTYTVTIPASIELTENSDKDYVGSGEISTSAVRLKKDETLDVTITASTADGFVMKTFEGAKQAYTITKTVDTTKTAVLNGDTIAQFETSESAQSVMLNYSSPNPKYAGLYKDTVTFTISVNSNIG